MISLVRAAATACVHHPHIITASQRGVLQWSQQRRAVVERPIFPKGEKALLNEDWTWSDPRQSNKVPVKMTRLEWLCVLTGLVSGATLFVELVKDQKSLQDAYQAGFRDGAQSRAQTSQENLVINPEVLLKE